MLTLTVEELNEYVRRTLAGDPMLHGLGLRGEISNFKRHVSGHWYFTLKDSQSSISCVIFRSAAASVRFAPCDGAQVTLLGSVGLYAKTGSYQFYAEGMEPDGLGELYLRMEALKKKLEKEGLFDPALKKPLPLLPKGIGIATSGTGAVLHDITRVAWRRDPGMPLYLYPVAVQGVGAAEKIARALAALDRLDAVDVIIVGRGGGSMEDLWPFNEEVVARAIAACRKPVVSAVTFAAFGADMRAPTPSAAAELAVPLREALLSELDKLARRMRRAGEASIADMVARVAAMHQTLTEQSPENRLRMIDEHLQSFYVRFALLCESQLSETAHRLNSAAVRLSAAGPQATLNRGYALLQQEGKTVPGIEQFQAELPFTVCLKDGRIDAKATRVRREEQL
jgi:exodeoxyribonuclease VII large subunit